MTTRETLERLKMRQTYLRALYAKEGPKHWIVRELEDIYAKLEAAKEAKE